MSAPILIPPRDEGKYVLDTDASDIALGAVLQQEHDGQLRVIGYASRALTNAERRYCITRKELLGVVYGLKKYRQHLLGRNIVVRTDHAALTFLKNTPEPIGQQGRWLDLMAEYVIEIQHRPGRVHGNSDALSRRPCERSGGKECQQCLRTIMGSKVTQARNAEASATGQVPSTDSPRPLAPSNSFWDESYDLPQWFTSETSTTGTPASSNFLDSPSPSTSIDQADKSASPVAPASPILGSSDSDAVTRVQAIAATPDPPPITMDDIRAAQAEDDNLLPVIQALLDQKQPVSTDLRQYPEEARILLAQWDSLVLRDGTLYPKFHYPDGTVNFLQIVLPTKLRRPFIERLHSELGHFGRTKTCYAVSRRAYFPGWRSYTGLLVRNCAVCNLHQRSRQTPRQATLKPMQEFRPMAVLHADLVGPLPEGRNSRNQRGFQYILSVVDSATRYLWLLPIRHKTADAVAATLFDEIISQVSVPSAILTDRGGEFLGEVVELLYKRLGITHLKTSAYRPQTDAKCERVHFSVHNMITKLVGDTHKRWPDLLGTVALAYNATVHTSTGYSPHELFYSFAPACPLDALVTTPIPEPVSNADEYALQAMERLQEATQFVRNYTGKQIQHMKQSYDASVRPKQFEQNEEVLLFDPHKKRGRFTKWSVTWIGPFRVKKRLNSCNYVLQKSAKSRPFVVHVDRMRPYLHELDDSDTALPPLSKPSDIPGRLPRSSSRMSDANTPSMPAVASHLSQ